MPSLSMDDFRKNDDKNESKEGENWNNPGQFPAFNVVQDLKGNKHIMDFSITSTREYRGTTSTIPNCCNVEDFESFSKGGRIVSATTESRMDDTGRVATRKTHDIIYHAPMNNPDT